MTENRFKRMLFLFVIMMSAVLLFPGTEQEIFKTETPPVLDGKLDDPVWQSALTVTGFKTFQPDYGKDASSRTIAYAAYDKENFYFAFRCYEDNPKKIKATLTKRDNVFGEDFASVILDTFNDKQGGYGFIVNPLGVQGDGMMDIGGNLNDSHDMVWYSKGVIDDEGYTVEIKIPFKSIRFPGKKKITMGIIYIRQTVRQSEYASFPEISPTKGSMLAQSMPVTVSGIKYKRVVELLPAFTHSRISSIDEGELKVEKKQSDVSFTSKFGITSGLTMDAAYNPDFSQVESDAGQVDVNLRYDLFYPEKRPFFLEGNEIFRFSGNTEDAPLVSIVHTRRIVDPILGFKVSGKIGWRNTLAAIYAIDETPDAELENNAHFSIFRFRHAIKKDTYLGGFYTGRDFSGGYNRILGMDGRIRLTPKTLSEYHFIGSVTNDRDEDREEYGYSAALRYAYESRKFIMDLGLQDISKDFRVDTGFLTRTGLTRFALFGMYKFYPKSKFFKRIEPFYWSYHMYDKYSDMFETMNLLTLRFQLPGNTQFRVDLLGGNEVFAGDRFNRSGAGFQLYGQLNKFLNMELFFRYNGSIYYDPDKPYQGKGNNTSLSIEYLPSDKLRTSVSITYADFYRSSDAVKIYDYTLIRNRTTFQLNKYLFFRGIAEYNFYYDKLLVDLLASFTYIPGTVVHLGYGSIYERAQWQDREYIPADNFLEIRRSFFFKISYLWRL
jgi:hypothetical protein